MTSKHTPGPWQVSGVRSRQEIYGHMVGPDGFGVACVAFSDRTDADYLASRADARLIAAAPDLLAAAKHAAQELIANLYPEEREELHGLSVALEKLNAAIAKAEGQPT